jgi:hypothetical protein
MLQLVIQYFDTPYTKSLQHEQYLGNQDALLKQHHHHQHVGTMAVICQPTPGSSGNYNSQTTNSISKKRSIDVLNAGRSPTTRTLPNHTGTVACFYQIFFSGRNTIHLVRQHVRFLPEHYEPPVSVSSSSTAIRNMPQPVSMVEYSDPYHTNIATPIIPHRNDQSPIVDVKVLGTTGMDGSDIDTTTIVLSYCSLRHRINNTQGMNGSSKGCSYSVPSTLPPQYDSYCMTLSASSSRRNISSSISTFPFVLPFMDDVVQHICLVTPNLIGVLSKRYHQIYLYDLYRGGLICTFQPFSKLSTNGNLTEISCISLLADMKRSKMAVTYISSTNPKKYCIAYTSLKGHNFGKQKNGPMSLADGLVTAVVATSSLLPSSHAMMSTTRFLYPDVTKLNDIHQNEVMIPQQNAIHNGMYYSLMN